MLTNNTSENIVDKEKMLKFFIQQTFISNQRVEMNFLHAHVFSLEMSYILLTLSQTSPGFYVSAVQVF